MQRTNDPGDDGFLNAAMHAAALRRGMYFPRECRWCATPLEVDGTMLACFLICQRCDDVEWAPADEFWGL